MEPNLFPTGIMDTAVREVTPNCWENEPGLCSGSKQPGADSEEALCLARAFVLQQIGGI